jgi:preprotein translocase SecE subunit
MNLSNYLKEIQKELKVTTFPGQNIVINFTVFVIVFTAIMAVYLGALDLGFGEAILKGIEILKTGGSDVAPVVATTTNATSTLIGTTTPNI